MSQVEIPKPLSCTIDKNGVKRATFDAKGLRSYVERTDDTVFFVETDKGATAPIVVTPLRACLEKSG